jgi:DUF1680 family protein
VQLTLDACKEEAFEILLRIPNWANGSRLKLNGEDPGVEVVPGHFSRIERNWRVGDVIELVMPMEITLIEGHNRIEEVRNQVAIKRGPIVYCIESPDLPKDAGIVDVYLPGDAKLTIRHQPKLLGGVTTVHGGVLIRQDRDDEHMYHTVNKPEFASHDAQFVPYFAWSNRGEAEMTVFMPVIWG